MISYNFLKALLVPLFLILLINHELKSLTPFSILYNSASVGIKRTT